MAGSSDSLGEEVVVAEAAADLSDKLYHAIAIGTGTPTVLTADHVVDIAGAGVRPDGYLVEPGSGINKVVHYRTPIRKPMIGVAGAAIATAGLLLVLNASGRLDVSTNGTSGDAIVGKSLAPASGDGSRFGFLPGNYGTVA